jgi:two-component system sensor histidine kinase KdpD
MSVHADLEFVETKKTLLRRWVSPITASVALLAATTVLLWALDKPLPHDHLVYVYFVPTALIAIRYGSVSAMCVTIGATFAAAYLFYAPRFSLAVESPLDMLELIFFSLLALLASQVVSGFAKDDEVKRRRWRASPRAPWPWFAARGHRIGR